jgi:excisionase family DNA binding protein
MIQVNDVTLLSPTEAAERLGITPRRVYALVRDERLPARRIGGRLLIERDGVEARVAGAPAAGRPFSPRRAWALILLEAGENPRGIDASTKSKLRRVLRGHDLWSMRSKLVDRAERRPLRAHSSDVAKIEAEPGVVRTGARCAADAGLGLIAPDAALELYLDRATAGRVVERYRLAPSPRPNVVLRIVTDEVRAWLRGPFAPPPAIALDLADGADSRAQDVAREALSRR